MFNMSQLWLELTKGTNMVAMPLIAGQTKAGSSEFKISLVYT